MEIKDVMKLLEEMKVESLRRWIRWQPSCARHAHITAANEEGIFFMTSPTPIFMGS